MIKSFHLTQYKSGDNELVVLAYKMYAVRMTFAVYSVVKCNEESKDIVMDVFAKLLNMSVVERKLKIPNNIEQFKGWLFITAKHLGLDFIRKRDVRVKHKPLGEEVVLSVVERKWDKQTADYVLNQLADNEQEIIRLHFDGYTNAEIAKLKKLSYFTVRNQLSSAKKNIKRYVQPSLIACIYCFFLIL